MNAARIIFASLLAVTFFAACGDGSSTDDDAATLKVGESALGVAPGTDAPDRDCNVVLNSVSRASAPTGYATHCTDGLCWYVWKGTLKLSDAAVKAGVPVVYFSASGSSDWHRVVAEPVEGGDEANLFSFTLDQHTVRTGLSMTSLMRTVIELIPALEMHDGSRLFDHNRNAESFQNYVLDQHNDWSVLEAEGLCQTSEATIRFLTSWENIQHGTIVRGGKVIVDYDLWRLPECRGSVYQGSPAWGASGYARFMPGGEIVSGPVSKYAYGSYGMSVEKALWEVDVPSDATSVEFWFVTNGRTCSSHWDSNFGNNHVFSVEGQPVNTRVEWAGNWGVFFSRACMGDYRIEDVPEPIVIDSWIITRSTCRFVEVDVWAPGLTDGDELRPELIQAQVQFQRDDGETQTAWLEFRQRVGNDYRYRWNISGAGLDFIYTPFDSFTYSFRFSTDGVNWFTVGADDSSPRTLVRGQDWCPYMWEMDCD